MSPRTHASVIKVFNIIVLVIGIPVFLMIGCDDTWDGVVQMFAFIALLVVVYLVLWHMPVRCSTPTCGGSMIGGTAHVSNWKARLTYRCSVCGATYETYIFHLPPSDPLP